jgi:hypothetical protein
MAATLASPETGLKSAAMHGIAFLHIAEGDAVKSSPFATFLLVLFVRGCAFI